MISRRLNSHRRIPSPVWLVVGMLVFSSVACMRQMDTLNQGKGTRDDPVTALQFAKTMNYDIRGTSVERGADIPGEMPASDHTFMRVEFEVICTKDSEQICDLENIAEDVKLVNTMGRLYPPRLDVAQDSPLSGEILGKARYTGWLVYEVPESSTIQVAVVPFSADGEDLVFFNLP